MRLVGGGGEGRSVVPRFSFVHEGVEQYIIVEDVIINYKLCGWLLINMAWFYIIKIKHKFDFELN